MSSHNNQGVMGADYAHGRTTAQYLKFRYQVRATVAANAARERLGGLQTWRVLELGAAEGRTLLYLRHLLGAEGDYVGVELSDGLLAAAPPMPGNTRMVKADVMDLPDALEPGTWDVVPALALLEHLPDPLACLQQAYRMLRPGGVFVATCPNPAWDEVAGHLGMVADEHHEQAMTARRMVNLAEQAGFVGLEYQPFMWAPIGVLPYLHIPIDPAWSLQVDAFVRQIPGLDLAFVNQAVVGVKPQNAEVDR